MRYNAFYHSGIKGMRWGIRRFQNEDGTYTEAGKARRRESEGDILARKVSYDNASKIASNAKNAVLEIDKMRKMSKKQDNSIKEMSDDELRKRVNRLNMERQYSQLTQPEVSKGANYAASVLSIAGSVLAIGASVTTIALGIQKLKKG